MKADDDFLKYCRANYHTPIFSREDFESDVNKIIILKKMFKRYHETGNLNERLALNNIIILLNVFGVEATNIILFYRLEKKYYPIIKTILIFLNSYRENPFSSDVDVDEKIMGNLTTTLR